jgi:hypothetical protein
MFKIKNVMSLVCTVIYEDFRNEKEKYTYGSFTEQPVYLLERQYHVTEEL